MQNTPVKTGRRKIHQRTRNGCLTCKIRKVKCDETRPYCLRCHSTGRKCDGYDDRHRMSPPNDLSLHRPSMIPGLDNMSSSILGQFYKSLEAEFLLPFGYLFWTRLVTKLIVQEPAVRHATISLVGLYEQRKRGTDTHPIHDTRILIQHYNSAMKEIRSLVSLRTTQLGTVLIACILFACIEFVRRDIPAAMIHIRYGIDMLNTSQDGSIIAIFFRHLSLLPIFTNQPLTSLPLITHGETCNPPESFSSFTVVQACINGLQYKAFKLARLKEELCEAQLRAADKTIEPAWLRAEQKELIMEVTSLQRKFMEFKKNVPDDRKLELTSCLLEVQWLLLNVWAHSGDSCTKHDASTKDFEEIIELARRSLALSSYFELTFEIGLTPHLHFVFIHCQDLRLRLRALSLLQRICLDKQDVLWNAEGIYRDCATILETSTEHGIKIGGLDTDMLDAVLESPFYGKASHAYRDLAKWRARDQVSLRLLASGTDGYACKDSGDGTRGIKLEQWSESGSESSSSSNPAARVDKFLYP